MGVTTNSHLRKRGLFSYIISTQDLSEGLRAIRPPDRRKLAGPTLFRKKLFGGVSLADTSDNQGQLGNGNKYGIAVCLRNDVALIVFCGTLRLDFFTKPRTVENSQFSRTPSDRTACLHDR